MNIGLIGYGGVGKAFVNLVKERNLNIKFKFILSSKGGYVLGDNGQTEWREGLNLAEIIDCGIDCLVELTPTNIKDGEPALGYIKLALERGIAVVTGNKGPIVHKYKYLKELANKNNTFLGIGCTVGGALPTICAGEVGLKGSEILSIEGVLNGTTNFILNEMYERGISYNEALNKAQTQGIAETNPYLDVEGYDTAIKMIIAANYFWETDISLKDTQIKGITKLSSEEIHTAKEENKKIKLIGKAYKENNKAYVKVEPTIIDKEHNLYNVEGKNKGVSFNSDILGELTIFGGASSLQNAAASILRDVNIFGELKKNPL